MKLQLCSALALCAWVSAANAHDTWVQTNTAIIRPGEAVYADLMLGNHGNHHRDFKLAGKIDLASSTLDVIAPDGRRYDLKDELVDAGYAPREGYWVGKFVPDKPGLYQVAHTLDKLHRTNHVIKSAKAYFLVSKSLDKVPRSSPGFEKPLGHALEIVPAINPVAPMGPGTSIRVRVLFRDKPLVGAQVSFIPRGAQLSEGFDEQFERKTDAEGRAEFTPKESNLLLIVVHHDRPDERGKDFDATHYSATMTLLVPQLCPCCED